ncbi:MAG: hypothetical protein ABI345_08015 [Jatrophihabitans sp.]
MVSRDTLGDAQDALYGAPSERFMGLRAELAKTVKAAGDVTSAKAIMALRKPTQAASWVNRFALQNPSAIDRLRDMHNRLQAAHRTLDAASMRALTTERRALVGELTDAVIGAADVEPSTGQRDEVTTTLDAAVADTEIADRLGRLTKSESFSGFGPVVTGSPTLTLLPGGKPKGKADRSATPGTTESRTGSVAQRRRQARSLQKSRSTLESASQRLSAAEDSEQAEARRVASLMTELTELQHELGKAKSDLEAARREVRAARAQRREARSALDAAERNVDS